jgi:hypothetical protein
MNMPIQFLAQYLVVNLLISGLPVELHTIHIVHRHCTIVHGE